MTPLCLPFSLSPMAKKKRDRKSLVSEEVSDSPVFAVNMIEEVADEDNGSSANNLAADQSNVIMEDTPEWAFDAHDVLHDDIALTVNVCDDVRFGSSFQQGNPSGKQAASASDHCYSMSTQQPSCSLSDHCYSVSESPRTLKRKASAVQEKLCAARKRLRL